MCMNIVVACMLKQTRVYCTKDAEDPIGKHGIFVCASVLLFRLASKTAFAADRLFSQVK